MATGIFNSGPTMGAIVAPIIVPLLAVQYGWQGAFVGTGVIGFFWVAGWWWLYRRPEHHPHITWAELDLIQERAGAPNTEKIPWIKLLKHRQTWAYVVGKMLPDPVWWFYLFWLPKFLAQEFGIRGTAQIAPLTTVYVLAGIGSVIGGGISSFLVKRGWSVNWARKATLGGIAVLMPLVIFAAHTDDPWTAVLLIGMGLALHRGFSTTVFTSASDLFPTKAIGSVIGIGGAISGIGSILTAEYTGRVLQAYPGYYLPMFAAAGTIYLVCLLVIHVLVPKLEPADLR